MNKMPKFTRRLVTVACSAALALGAASNANAGVLAQGVLEITNFFLTDTAGVPLNESDFNFIVANHTTDGTATLNGASDVGSESDFVYPYALDMLQQSVGVNPFVEDDYTHRPAGYGGYFARTDTRLFGDSICFDVSGVCPPSGVTAQVVGEVQLNANGSGSTQANIGLQAEFNFSLANAQAVRVDFDADDYLIAFMGALSAVPGSSAFASSGWTLTLTGPGVNFVFAPDGILNAGAGEVSDPCSLNTSRSALTPNAPAGNVYICSDHFTAESPVLLADTTYQLSIRHTIATDAEKVLLQVPEPGTIGLLGAGLLGLFGALRTRRRDRT